MSMSEKCVCLGLAVAASAIALAVVRRQWGSKRPPYPPGPKGYPIIGNVFDLPKNPVWEGLTKMAQEYDTDILYLNVMGIHLVVLNSGAVAIDLLERRSVMYADRPRLPMINELMGCTWSFALMHYGNLWRTHRRLMDRFFNFSAVNQFDDKIHGAVNAFLHQLSESPERFLKHAHFLAASLTSSVAYGMNIESESDEFFSTSENALAAVNLALTPRVFLVDPFPILKNVPEWFPGGDFKRFARVAKKNLDDSLNLPFQHVKESLEAKTLTTSSIVATCLEGLPELARRGVDEEAIRGVNGTIYLAGEDTTFSATKSFFLAVTLYPEVVRLAQQELDEVLSGERLPDFSDKPRLPYISAIVKEVLRWRPPSPLGIPHRLMEDDVYEGQFIPAGAIIIDNIWAMFRDESVYSNAHIFNPDRFLKDGQINPNVKDPEHLLFGHGRRICPGRHFALRVLFLTIACTLATFDISKCLDEDGNPIVPEEKYTSGFVTSNIRPRSAQALSLIAGH